MTKEELCDYKKCPFIFTARPYWIEEPRDIETSIGAKATFLCRAGGIPTPRIYWFINGVPMNGM